MEIGPKVDESLIMQKDEYKNIFLNEGKHFYYVANHNLITQFLRKFLPNLENIKILDAGCGTGLLAKKLEKFGYVEGIDIALEAVELSKKRGIKAKIGSVNKLPFKDNNFDVVISMDVLYHNEVNDLAALEEFQRVLKPGGILILRVPAISWLFSLHDKHVYTRERYNAEGFKEKLIKAGFEVHKLSYINTILFLPALLKVIKEKIFINKNPHSIIQDVPSILNDLLIKLLSVENSLLNYINFPIGIGLLSVSSKPHLHKHLH